GICFIFTSAGPSANAVLKRVSAVPGLPHLKARNAYSYRPAGSSVVGKFTVVRPTALPPAVATGLRVVASGISSREVHGKLHVNPVCSVSGPLADGLPNTTPSTFA